MSVFTTYKNKRIEPDNFEMEFPCSFCNCYSPVVISIPDTNKKICKSCLSEMINFIDKTILDDTDFNIFNFTKNKE